MKWEHLNFEQRKIIRSMLSHKAKLVEIATILNMDPTSISKEIKRNRYISKNGSIQNKECKYTKRFPYCCNHCSLKYTTCSFNQYTYEAKRAQEKADYLLKHSRIGLNITENDFKRIDKIVKDGVSNKQSIYHISKSNDNFPSPPTIYRWIHEKKLTTSLMDLPYAVTYKKRKIKEKYDYSKTKINRSNRTFLDYLEHRRLFPGEFTVQMDFLGKIVSDSNEILTLSIPEIHFVLLILMNKPNQDKIAKLFDTLEGKLGFSNYTKLFPFILTDRDPCFIDYLGIEISKETGELRSRIYYCDSFNSCQKANVENMNKQLRKYFPKKQSIDHYTQKDITSINNTIINQKIPSLSGNSPKEAFIKVFGKPLLDLLFEVIFNYK